MSSAALRFGTPTGPYPERRDAALSWLFGVNPLLGDRRPVDLIRLGRAEELMRAIRAERSDSFA